MATLTSRKQTIANMIHWMMAQEISSYTCMRKWGGKNIVAVVPKTVTVVRSYNYWRKRCILLELKFLRSVTNTLSDDLHSFTLADGTTSVMPYPNAFAAIPYSISNLPCSGLLPWASAAAIRFYHPDLTCALFGNYFGGTLNEVSVPCEYYVEGCLESQTWTNILHTRIMTRSIIV